MADISIAAAPAAAKGRSATSVLAGTALLAVLLALILGRIVGFDLRKDELLYSAPIGLGDGVALYRDVFYNHVPGSALYFRAVADVLGDGGVLLAGRLAVFAAWVAFAAALVGVALAMTGSAVVAFAVAALFLGNDLLLGVTGMTATNNFLPLPAAFAGLALFALGALGARPRPALVFAAGVFLSVAATLKLSAAVFIPLVALWALVGAPAPLGVRLRGVTLPLAAGGVLGALPVLRLLWSDGERFLAHVVGYNTGPHIAWWRANLATEPDVAFGLAGKAELAYAVAFTGGVMAAIVALAVLAADRAGERRGGLGTVLFAAAAFVLSLAFAFVPTPAFPQYFALPLAPLALLLIALAASPGRGVRPYAAPVLVGAAAVALLANAPRLASGLESLRPSAREVHRIHADGVELHDVLAAAGATGPLATLMPIYAYEGRLAPVPELATGPFGYRAMPQTPPELAVHYRTLGPDRIGEAFDRDPPAAFLLGFDPALEAPLAAWAAAHGYEPLPLVLRNRYGEGHVLVRRRDPAP